MSNKHKTVFDSRFTKKGDKELIARLKFNEEELAFLTKLFQAYKQRNKTESFAMEAFIKELIFSHADIFKKEVEYDELYPEKKESK